MEQKKKLLHRLIEATVLDPKDELDEKLQRCFNTVTGLTKNLSEREANDALQTLVHKGGQHYEEVQLGLFYGIIVDPKSAQRYYRDMALVSRDGLTMVLTKTNQVIHEKWIKLQDSCRTQVVWFAKELVKNSVRGADSVCHSLIRQIAGGDVSPKNVWLAESLLDLFVDNKGWLEKHGHLLATAVYTYLRVIVDHTSANFATLRQREVEFCIAMLREKWADCMVIGRDLVRLLQYVARIPEVEKLWKDILFNPTVLNPQFAGIQQLMQTRTSRWYFVSRLTPDMENKLNFLTTKVRFGQQKRYQDWFQRQYLSTPESQSLRYDLIRYICAVIHPSNEVLCSDIIPRWAVIGWLLTTCTSNVAASNAKLSLFYDWLFFDPDKDSIMNIEPCILVMYHSMRPHPAITATLLDFMCRIMPNFHPPMSVQVKKGIFTALRSILDKRVLQSLSPLFDNPKLDKELRSMIRENFSEFCSADVAKMEEPPVNHGENMMVIDLGGSSHMLTGGTPPPQADNHSMGVIDVAEFSDEEDDIPLGKLKKESSWFEPIKEPDANKLAQVNISEFVDELDGEIKQCLIDLHSESGNELQCEMMDKLIQAIIQEADFDQDIAMVLGSCLTKLLSHQVTDQLLPHDMDEESVEDSIGTPLFVIFRNLCQTPEEDPARQPILLLLEEMYNKQPRIGYYFLYFLKVGKVHDERMSTYKDFCSSMESRDLTSCLQTDLKLCAEYDVRLFAYLIPDIYTQFPNIAIGNTDLLHLIVSSIDGIQLQDLVCQILQGHLVMYRKDSFLSVLNASLEWETIEQYFLWQLISAHNIPVEHIMPILPKLEFNTHAEALSSIMVLLKQEGPSLDLIRPILCRECKRYDFFVVSILKYWAQESEDRLADLLQAQLTRSASTPSRKRKGSQQQQSSNKNKEKEKEAPSVEQVLSHLEHMRSTCRNISFLTNESIQQGLQHVMATSTESLKTKFSELLALVEDFEDLRTTRVLRAVPSRRASQCAGQLNSKVSIPAVSAMSKNKKIQEESDSDTESSDEDEIIKPPKSKKRKKTTVEDDSD